MRHDRQHIIYSYMLDYYVLLKERDKEALRKAHGLSDEKIKQMKWRSAPCYVQKMFIEDDFARLFDLRGIAGFYFDADTGVWRLNTKEGTLLLPYYRENIVAGLMVFRSASDRRPRPLTSRGLPSGTKAIRPELKAA